MAWGLTCAALLTDATVGPDQSRSKLWWPSTVAAVEIALNLAIRSEGIQLLTKISYLVIVW